MVWGTIPLGGPLIRNTRTYVYCWILVDAPMHFLPYLALINHPLKENTLNLSTYVETAGKWWRCLHWHLLWTFFQSLPCFESCMHFLWRLVPCLIWCGRFPMEESAGQSDRAPQRTWTVVPTHKRQLRKDSSWLCLQLVTTAHRQLQLRPWFSGQEHTVVV